MFMHGLNPQLHQLARTILTSGNLEEVIELVKKAMVYGEDKRDHLKLKLKTNKYNRVEKKAARGIKANGALVVDQRERSRSFQEAPSRRSLPEL